MIQENCSPATKKHIKGSCLSVPLVHKMKDQYNKTHKNKIQSKKNKDIIQELALQLSCNKESCLTEKLGEGSRMFAPKMPRSWLSNSNEWLSSLEFIDIFKGYEEAHPDFLFLGPAASDYEHKINGQCEINELCTLDVRKLPKGVKKIGIVFNLDQHDEPGSHWVSMYISVKKKTVYYFDSAGSKILPTIYALYKHIHAQDPDYRYVDNYPLIHQYGNNECGMYSIFFILIMLFTENYSYFTKKRWRDSSMNALRKKLFNA
jgi:hypothetical protein